MNETGNVMYVGPTIANAVRHSTVFKNGVLPDAVSACVSETPAMAKLFVELDALPAAMKQLSAEKSALKSIYTLVKEKYVKQKGV